MAQLDGAGLSFQAVVAIAKGRESATPAPGARERVAESAAFGARAAAERPVYGRTTGVGANRSVALADPAAQALDLLRSHATSAGPLRSRERVRAMLAVRLNQLAAGGSGVSVTVFDALAAMLADDTLPAVHELGGVGTGDLPALASTALALGGLRETTPALRAPVPLGIGDALGFISSNAATLGDTALALGELHALARAALTVAALSHVSVDGNIEAYSAAVERTTPFPGARAVCGTMRERLAGGASPARIQDPFGLRALPQVHGPLLDRLDELDAVFSAMANAPTENPVLLPGLPVAHHAAFHAAYLAQALDAARAALAQAAQLGLSRITMLSEPALTGLAPFLAEGTPGTSGTMVVEYTAASALAQLRAVAPPVATQSVTLSRGLEEDASFASLGAATTLAAVPVYRTLIACELVVALRCLRMRAVPVPDGLARAFAACAGLPSDVRDRDLTEDIAAAEALLPGLAVDAG
jgi:histidine ammonia-lyase